MAHYTDVQLVVEGSVVGTAPRAEVGLPTDSHRLTVPGVTWKGPDRNAFLKYLQKPCTVQAKGPQDKTVKLPMKITGTKGDNTVFLD